MLKKRRSGYKSALEQESERYVFFFCRLRLLNQVPLFKEKVTRDFFRRDQRTFVHQVDSDGWKKRRGSVRQINRSYAKTGCYNSSPRRMRTHASTAQQHLGWGLPGCCVARGGCWGRGEQNDFHGQCRDGINFFLRLLLLFLFSIQFVGARVSG